MKSAFIACAALAAGCAAPSRPPDAGASPALSLAAAERAFAAHSVRENMRSAFLAHFADDGVLVVGGEWVTALPALRAQAARAVVLDWHPAYVEAARAGDLGLSTGPWQLTSQGAPPRHGHFVSVWRYQAGRWRVAADIGISHPDTPLLDAAAETRVAGTADEPGDAAALDAAQRDFARIASTAGERAALRRHAAANVRLYREGSAPSVGLDAALAAVNVGDATRSFTLQQSGVARSGDIAYARGSYAMENGAHGAWLRVWRHEAGGWHIALDIANAAS